MPIIQLPATAVVMANFITDLGIKMVVAATVALIVVLIKRAYDNYKAKQGKGKE